MGVDDQVEGTQDRGFREIFERGVRETEEGRRWIDHSLHRGSLGLLLKIYRLLFFRWT